jgi:hypothetical protein
MFIEGAKENLRFVLSENPGSWGKFLADETTGPIKMYRCKHRLGKVLGHGISLKHDLPDEFRPIWFFCFKRNDFHLKIR